MVKHIQTIRLRQPTNCLNVFDYFVGLTLKGLNQFKQTNKLLFTLQSSENQGFDSDP